MRMGRMRLLAGDGDRIGDLRRERAATRDRRDIDGPTEMQSVDAGLQALDHHPITAGLGRRELDAEFRLPAFEIGEEAEGVAQLVRVFEDAEGEEVALLVMRVE